MENLLIIKIGKHLSMTIMIKEKQFIDNKVSVIIPLYNAECFIIEAIKSVQNQNYKNIEIIVVDDCSTDKSAEILKNLRNEDACIHYYKLNENSGVAVARNRGIELSTGRYLAFLDSDDIWLQGKLDRQLKLFKKYRNTAFAYTAIKIIDESGKIIKEKRNIPEYVDYKFILRNTVIATSTVMIDRFIVPSIIMPNRRSAEDYSLWLSLLRDYGAAHGINEAYTLYRKSRFSVSSKRMGEVKYFYAVQTEDMGISKRQAIINTFFYILHAVIKHFF